MQQLPGKRPLTLVVALAFAAAAPAIAQDTTEAGGARFDTTEAGAGAIDTAGADTSGQMDRDTSAVSDTAAMSDTSAVRDTTDTSAVQNPPGYRGMERDTTIFPPKDQPSATPEQVEDRTTGTYEDSAWRDTTGAEQNPAGYRGMERPAGEDSAAGHDGAHPSGAGDTTAQTPDSVH